MIKKHNEDQSSTFAIDHFESTFNEQSTQENEARKSKKEKKSCVCDIMHRWVDCYYMILEKRSNDWTSNLIIKTKIDEALKNKKLKTAVEKVLKY
jgi:hypothetical protein